MQADFTSEPTVAEDGKIWTPGAVDFFRIVNEQVGVPSQGCRVVGLWCPRCPPVFEQTLAPYLVHPAEFVQHAVQVTVVEEVSRGELLLQVGQMAVLVMRDFQVWHLDRFCCLL